MSTPYDQLLDDMERRSRPSFDAPVTSGYGARRDGGRRQHRALDLAYGEGEPVSVNRGGRVLEVGSDRKSGNYVKIDHGDGYMSSYSHLQGADVNKGDEVLPDTPFARSGRSGTKSPHLHFVVRQNGQRVDPETTDIRPSRRSNPYDALLTQMEGKPADPYDSLLDEMETAPPPLALPAPQQAPELPVTEALKGIDYTASPLERRPAATPNPPVAARRGARTRSAPSPPTLAQALERNLANLNANIAARTRQPSLADVRMADDQIGQVAGNRTREASAPVPLRLRPRSRPNIADEVDPVDMGQMKRRDEREVLEQGKDKAFYERLPESVKRPEMGVRSGEVDFNDPGQLRQARIKHERDMARAGAEAARIASVPASAQARTLAGNVLRSVGELPAGVLDTVGTLAYEVDKRAFDSKKERADYFTTELAKRLRGNLKDVLPADERLQGNFLFDTLPQAVGSALGFAGPGVVTKSKYVIPAFLGVTSGFSEGYNDAKRHGASDDDALKSGLLNGGVGATEVITAAPWIGRVNRATRGLLGRKLAQSGAETAEEAIAFSLKDPRVRAAIVREMKQEGGQEAFQTGFGNYVANTVVGYDPNRRTLESVPSSAAAGALIGTGMSAGTQAASGRRILPPKSPVVVPDTSQVIPAPESPVAATEAQTAPITEAVLPDEMPMNVGFSSPRVVKGTYQPPRTPSYQHLDFGLVVEDPDQSGVARGDARVIDESGVRHVIQRPNGRGQGNERAIPIKTETPDSGRVQEVEAGSAGADVRTPSSRDDDANANTRLGTPTGIGAAGQRGEGTALGDEGSTGIPGAAETVAPAVAQPRDVPVGTLKNQGELKSVPTTRDSFRGSIQKHFKLRPMEAEAVATVADALDEGLTKFGLGRGSLFGRVAGVGSGKGAMPSDLPQTAWHGSPHEFDKFELSDRTALTGEGASAYGHGLYFAGSRKVAEYYRKQLAGKISDYYVYLDGKNITEWKDGRLTPRAQAANMIARHGYDTALEDARADAPNGERQREVLRQVQDLKGAKAEIRDATKGRLYKVDLAPAEDEYLLWDKPLSEQSDKVKKALKGLTDVTQRPAFRQNISELDLGEHGKLWDYSDDDIGTSFKTRAEAEAFAEQARARSGDEIYKALVDKLGSDMAASEHLKSLGIRGVKYLDEGSRDQGRGSHNYVIFDDADVRIEEVLRQNERAATQFLNDGRAVIKALKNPNVSSGAHETHHVFAPVFAEATLKTPKAELRETGEGFFKWMGFEGAEEFNTLHTKYVDGTLTRAEKRKYVDGQEKGARGFERYLKTGDAPSVKLREVFAQFKEWLTSIYGSIRGKDHPLRGTISPEAIKAWDTVLGAPKGEHGQVVHQLYKSGFFENASVKRAAGLKEDATADDVRAAITKSEGRVRSSYLHPEMLQRWAAQKGVDAEGKKQLETAIEAAKAKREAKAPVAEQPAPVLSTPLDQFLDNGRAANLYNSLYEPGRDYGDLEARFRAAGERAGVDGGELDQLIADARESRGETSQRESTQRPVEGAPAEDRRGGRVGQDDVDLLFQAEGARKVTDTPEFKRFFRGSKVVDAQGAPQVVYHGSPDVRGIFEEGFKPFSRGEVFFASDSYKLADSYADDRRAFDYQNAEPQTIPLYLSIKNPLVIDAKGQHWRGTEKHIQQAKDGGHDGIIIKNSIDEYNNSPASKPATVYAWFKSEQAKSAVEGQLRSRVDSKPIPNAVANRGTFDPSSPNILYQAAPTPQAQAKMRAAQAIAKRQAKPKSQPVGGLAPRTTTRSTSSAQPELFKGATERKVPLGERIADVANLPRSLKSSVDLSAAMRQGAMFTLTHPARATKIFFGQQLKSLGNKGFEEFKQSLRSDPDAKLMRESGLHLSTIAEESISNREEAFASNLVGKLPVFGGRIGLVTRSEQAYTTFLDSARSTWFKQLARQAEDASKKSGKPVTLQQYKDIARFVNVATGRGDLGKGKLNDAAPLLNAAFFSPRYVASKVQVLDPRVYARLPEGARKTAIRQAVQYFATIGATALLLKGLGADVGDDPESSDFGKVKVDDTRYDLTAGHAQYMTLAARLLRNAQDRINGDKPGFGKDAASNLQRFVRYKLAPLPAAAVNVITGRNPIGQETTLANESLELVTPIYLKDLYEAYEKEGGAGLLKTAPGFIGVGVQTYSPREQKGRAPERPRRRRERRAER